MTSTSIGENKLLEKVLRYSKYNGPVINIIATVAFAAALFGIVDINWYIALFVYFLYWCIGISITYHRYISHFSFQFKAKWIEKLCFFIAACAGQGDGFTWAAVHRHHHKNADTPEDPHGPHNGFWMYFLVQGYDNVPVEIDKRLRNRMTFFLFKNYTLFLAGWWLFLLALGFVFPLGYSFEWALMSFGLVPVGIYQLVANITVQATHTWGYRNFEVDDNARNNWWISIISFGEGWHNNHHARPRKYTFQVKWWEFDLGAFIVKHVLADKNTLQK